MIRKFFPLDKNYLLEEAQLFLQSSLLSTLVETCKVRYESVHNPLQLTDAFSKRIMDYRPGNLKPLDGFYQTLAAVYRYKFGDNQLEFLWDGISHFEKYKQEWKMTFDLWTKELLRQDQFVQAVLDLTVFLPENRHAHLAENRMNFVMLEFFAQKEGFPELRYKKSKGLVEMKVA